MRLLIIDKNAEWQSRCARKIEAFGQSDIETLDLRIKLVDDQEYKDKVQDADVVLLGAGLGETAVNIARNTLMNMPWLYVIMYVDEEAYSGGAFRAAHSAGVRKVLPNDSDPLDLLQELVAIHAEFKKEGKVREGKIILVTHAKGGTGATTVCAALAEVCNAHQKRTMLWDMDVETRDLCRSLTVNGPEAKVVSAMVNGSKDISRDVLCEALIPISQDVSVFMPPDNMAESMDLVCHTDGMTICQRLLELARVMHDVIIIDSGGRMGPASGVLTRAADEVVIVIDDTVLGLTALDIFLSYVKALVAGVERITFLVNGYSGALLGVPQIEAELEPVHNLGAKAWRLPPVPVDAKASLWPGSGKTLYSMGNKNVRAALEQIAVELGLIDNMFSDEDSSKKNAWWERLLPSGTNTEVPN